MCTPLYKLMYIQFSHVCLFCVHTHVYIYIYTYIYTFICSPLKVSRKEQTTMREVWCSFCSEDLFSSETMKHETNIYRHTCIVIYITFVNNLDIYIYICISDRCIYRWTLIQMQMSFSGDIYIYTYDFKYIYIYIYM